MHAELRPYDAADLGCVLDIWHAASRVGHPFLSAEFLAFERTQLRDNWLPAAQVTVAVTNHGLVVGFISMVDDEIGGLFVDPDVHRTGIARQLLAHVRDGRAALELGVFERNDGARQFYEQAGFVVTGERASVEGNVEIRMRWELGPAA